MSRRLLSLMALVMIVLGYASIGYAATETPAAPTSGSTTVLLSDIGAGRLGGPIGAGFVLIGGGIGIGRVSASACEAVARQPEAGGRIFTFMILGAAIIEGTTLFGVVVCLLPIIK